MRQHCIVFERVNFGVVFLAGFPDGDALSVGILTDLALRMAWSFARRTH